ncbi:hypothetical protein, partial [Variovorax sp. WS11]|uniref:hypothetical protein n=1 Tax=Variovorax sp. WS11 TaxID=1105204 RepID=UPI001C639D48
MNTLAAQLRASAASTVPTDGRDQQASVRRCPRALRIPKAKSPTMSGWAFWGCKSLTMTYFHTGTRTIIGAEAFH